MTAFDNPPAIHQLSLTTTSRSRRFGVSRFSGLPRHLSYLGVRFAAGRAGQFLRNGVEAHDGVLAAIRDPGRRIRPRNDPMGRRVRALRNAFRPAGLRVENAEVPGVLRGVSEGAIRRKRLRFRLRSAARTHRSLPAAAVG